MDVCHRKSGYHLVCYFRGALTSQSWHAVGSPVGQAILPAEGVAKFVGAAAPSRVPSGPGSVTAFPSVRASRAARVSKRFPGILQLPLQAAFQAALPRLRRVGHRRVALSHVSCAPSSNGTCGFPASSSPTTFFRRRAPQARQMAHSPYHLIQPTPFVQELIVPMLPSRPPTALVLASEP